jgi:hypothetical protein
MQITPAAAGRIRIHNEFDGFPRFFGANPRPITGAPQTIHPFAQQMIKLLVNYKTDKEQSHYQLRAEFNSMPVAKEFLSNGVFRSNC